MEQLDQIAETIRANMEQTAAAAATLLQTSERFRDS